MLAGMNTGERRSWWAALLLATCMGLPLQTWADAEMSEKMRFETQAQAVTVDHTTEADVEQIIPAIPLLPHEQSTPSSNPAETEQAGSAAAEPAAEPEDLFTDDFEDDVEENVEEDILDVLIELKEGLLTVDVQDAALNQVLTAVAEQGNFRVLFVDPAQNRISLAFADLPLKKGLEELLKGHDHIFRYSGKNGSLSTVAVYARKTSTTPTQSLQRQPAQHTQAIDPQSIDPDEPDVALLSAQALGSPDEDVRLEAVEELADLDNPAETAHVLTEVLLKDENSDVREAALESLADFEDQDFQRRAASLSINDSEQDIRMRAVEILTDIEDWDTLRDVAQTHDDPEIRALANDALEDEQ